MVAYPDISFLTFFGVPFRLSHTLYFTFTCFLAVAYPDISFLTFFGVRAFSYITYYDFSTLLLTETYPTISFLTFFGVCILTFITYYVFSTLLFARNVPRYFTFAISRGTTLHHTIHTLPPTTHKSILWRCFAPEYALFSFSFVSNSVPLTGIISRSTTYSIIFVFRFR